MGENSGGGGDFVGGTAADAGGDGDGRGSGGDSGRGSVTAVMVGAAGMEVVRGCKQHRQGRQLGQSGELHPNESA